MIIKYLITRICTGINGTFGVISEIIKDTITPFALTLERQWLDNQKSISCIPTGEYICMRVNSPKFGDTFEICNVPNRDHILFHRGNIDDDSHGCVLVGEQFGTLNGSPSIQASKEGYGEFMNKNTGLSVFGIKIIWSLK